VDFPGFTICSNSLIQKKQLTKVLSTEEYENKCSPNVLNKSYFRWKKIRTDMELDVKMNDLAWRNLVSASLNVVLQYDSESTSIDDLDERGVQLIDKYKHNMTKMIRKVQHQCEDMLLLCKWDLKVVDCKDLFSMTRADHGFCCSFNVIKSGEQL